MNPENYKYRRTWNISPMTKVHSSKKGKKGYSRAENKKVEKSWNE